MRGFPAIAIIVTLLIIVGGVIFFTRDDQAQQPPANPTSHEYFWGEGCPHCATVQEFLDNWEGKERVQIDKKEVYQNQDNARLLNQRARSCGLPLAEVGVPFLYTPGGQCLVGDSPIIQFFESLEE